MCPSAELGHWLSALPRVPPAPSLSSGRKFEEMSHPDLVALLDYARALSRTVEEWWTTEAATRGGSGAPPRQQPSKVLARFFARVFACDTWRTNGHLEAVHDFDGYQSEFALMVEHVRHTAPPDTQAKRLWAEHVEATGVAAWGKGPRRHTIAVLFGDFEED